VLSVVAIVVLVVAVLVVALLVVALVLAAIVARGHVALDLGLVVDRGGQRAAADQLDREQVVLERVDRTDVLVAVLDAVVVGVGITRVQARLELRAVLEPVVVLAAAALLLVQTR
jgi:hypothetical protein